MISAELFEEASALVYSKVMQAFDQLDPDIAEADFHLDNVTIVFSSGVKFIINRQPPVRQLWLATKKRGYHFNYDKATASWICDHSQQEFYSILNEAIYSQINLKLKF